MQHLRHHLGVRLERDADGRPAAAMPLLPQHRTRHGAVSAGAVATLVDVASGLSSGDQGTGPAVTSHLALRLPPVGGCGRLRAHPTIARAGRTSVVNVVHVVDPDRDGAVGAAVGVATVTFTVLPGRGGSHVPDPTLDVPSLWTNADQVPVDMTTDELVGLRRRGDSTHDDAAYEMALAPHLRNVNGVLHGGGLVLAAEHAALTEAERAGVAQPAVDEIDVHFLAAATVGPLVATVMIVGDHGPGPDRGNRGRLTMLVDAVDEGHGGRRVGVALVGVAGAGTAGRRRG
jgi:acyl-coenzyme A thioesterase PaaI-like protein